MAYPKNLGQMSLRYNDYNSERSNVSMAGTLLTAANFDAQAALALALRDAIAGVANGLLVGFDFGNRYQTVDPGTPSADVTAQRELKWLVRYQETGEAIQRMEIPCPDMTLLDPNNRGYMLISSGAGQQFVSAFEDYILGSEGGAVTVIDVKLVGRNV